MMEICRKIKKIFNCLSKQFKFTEVATYMMSTEFTEFEIINLNEMGIQKLTSVKEAFNLLLRTIIESAAEKNENNVVLSSRELSICKSKLEEAFMFAYRNIANQKINQK